MRRRSSARPAGSTTRRRLGRWESACARPLSAATSTYNPSRQLSPARIGRRELLPHAVRIDEEIMETGILGKHRQDVRRGNLAGIERPFDWLVGQRIVQLAAPLAI